MYISLNGYIFNFKNSSIDNKYEMIKTIYNDIIFIIDYKELKRFLAEIIKPKYIVPRSKISSLINNIKFHIFGYLLITDKIVINKMELFNKLGNLIINNNQEILELKEKVIDKLFNEDNLYNNQLKIILYLWVNLISCKKEEVKNSLEETTFTLYDYIFDNIHN